MSTQTTLTRFLEAQKGVYETALAEIRKGKKTSHWMWFIFPQIRGLGLSDMSKFYAIQNQAEAVAYLNHEILGKRLVKISTALLALPINNPVDVFGTTDSMKLLSSMTLFSLLKNTNPVFQQVLDKFYGGGKDEKTIQLLNANA